MARSLAGRAFANRRLMRAPIGLYRIGMGWVFGRRLIMLEHTGRTSGAARFVVLEVVARQSPNEVIIASALGRRAQWFQNLVATPACHVSIGVRRRVPALAEVLDAGDAATFLTDYESRHPVMWKELKSMMDSLHDGDPKFAIPLVRLILHAEEGSE